MLRKLRLGQKKWFSFKKSVYFIWYIFSNLQAGSKNVAKFRVFAYQLNGCRFEFCCTDLSTWWWLDWTKRFLRLIIGSRTVPRRAVLRTDISPNHIFFIYLNLCLPLVYNSSRSQWIPTKKSHLLKPGTSQNNPKPTKTSRGGQKKMRNDPKLGKSGIFYWFSFFKFGAQMPKLGILVQKVSSF